MEKRGSFFFSLSTSVFFLFALILVRLLADDAKKAPRWTNELRENSFIGDFNNVVPPSYLTSVQSPARLSGLDEAIRSDRVLNAFKIVNL